MIARSLLSCACAFAVLQNSAWCCEPDPSQDALALASFVPADVTTYITVADGARLRHELGRFPLSNWLTRWSVSPELAQAWSSLAQSAHVTSGQLFDKAFGSGFTLVVRNRGKTPEWAIASHVEPEHAKDLMTALKPRLVEYGQHMRVYDVPEHQLLLSRTGNLLLIGPRGEGRGLFDTVCDAIALDIEWPLVNDSAFAAASAINDGSLFAFVRHAGSERPLPQYQVQFASNSERAAAEREMARQRGGSWTAVAGSLHGNVLTLRHASSQPIAGVERRDDLTAWDMAPLKAIGSRSSIALIKPVNEQSGLIELVVSQGLGGDGWRAAIEGQHAGRRIFVVDSPNNQSSGTTGVRVVVASAVELKGDAATTKALMVELEDENARVRNLDVGAYLVPSEANNQTWLASSHLRDYACDQVATIFGGLPVMQPRPVQWTVTSGPDAEWCVMSNDQDKLDAMAEALAAASDESCKPAIGAWVSCGAGDGRSLASMLRAMAKSGKGLPAQVRTMTSAETLAQLSAVADVVDQFSWSLERTDDDRLSLEINLTLRETASPAAR